MPIRIYNTLTQTKETFVPREEGKVSMYACGLTPQGPAHIGHLRGAVALDAIRRWLVYRGYQLRALQNFTDIDDKIIRKAAAEGIPPAELAERFAAAYLKDWESMELLPVEFVRVTENMDAIIDLIATLVERGHAYAVDNGDVYFSVASFPEYGKLSRQETSLTEAGARVEVGVEKRDAADFALWKAATPGEPFWASPWGNGRPGWHIECSALALTHLGPAFDIHAGGIDLKFPHHENEIAQSEAACDVHPFARCWMHWGVVTRDGKKMAQSVGNFFTIREILEKYSADVVKLYVMSTHYRSPIEYSAERLAESARSFERVTAALSNAQALSGVLEGAPVDSYLFRFSDAMDDDFNTAQAIGVVFEAVGELNRVMAEKEHDVKTIGRLAVTIQEMLGLLGIEAGAAAEPATPELTSALIERAIAWRQDARASMQFTLSDRIRDDLGAIGVVLEDRPTGTTWRLER